MIDAASGGQAKGGDHHGTPLFLPGRLMIKLKSGKDLTGLDNLNRRTKVLTAQGVFGQRETPEKRLNVLKAKRSVAAGPQRTVLEQRIRKLENTISRLKNRQQRKGQDPLLGLPQCYLLEFEATRPVGDIAKEYSQHPDIEYAEPVFLYSTQMVPNDPYYHSSGTWRQNYDDLWGLKAIHMEQAWDQTQGAGVVVAVVDTGVDYNHIDIAQNIWVNPAEIVNGVDDDGNGFTDDVRGWDFTTCSSFGPTGCLAPKTQDNDPKDLHGHGTHVSGTIAAVGNNGIGIIGVAPQAQIMPVKGLNDGGQGSSYDLAKAIIYAADNGADVINGSWGSSAYSRVLADAIAYAYELGCLQVFAAGNDNMPASYFYPATDPHVITVAASNPNLTRASFSNYGIGVDVVAPGEDILSLKAEKTYLGSTVGQYYCRLKGTSMAAPHVSGVVALILAVHPEWVPDQVRTALAYTDWSMGAMAGEDRILGYGHVDAKAAAEFQPTFALPGIYGTIRDLAQVDMLKGQLSLTGSVGGPGFQGYRLYVGQSRDVNLTTGYQWQLLNEYQGTTPIENGFLGEIDTTFLEDGHYTFRLVVQSNAAHPQGGNYDVVIPYDRKFIGNRFKAGWPRSLGNVNDINLFDDNSGKQNILAAELTRLWLLNGDGAVAAGHWPVDMTSLFPQEDSVEMHQPAVGDIDGDGVQEIVWGGSSYVSGDHGQGILMVLDGNGNLKGGAWSAPRLLAGKMIHSGVTLYDVNGDGRLEIMFITQDYSGSERVHNLWVLDHLGNPYTVWPKRLDVPADRILVNSSNFLAAGDMDGDPATTEIAVGTTETSKYYPGQGAFEGSVFVFNADDGSSLPGWPYRSGLDNMVDDFYGMGPMLGNLDDDRQLELAILGLGSSRWYAFGHDGQIQPGWPQSTYSYSGYFQQDGAFADLDGDSRAEIMMAGTSEETDPQGNTSTALGVYARRGDGSAFGPQWPRLPIFLKDYCVLNLGGKSTTGPSIADLNGDDQLDIIVHASHRLFAFDKDGGMLSDFPALQTMGASPEKVNPVIGDIDGDGLSELITIDGTQRIYVWDLEAKYHPYNVAWPMVTGNPQRTGLFKKPEGMAVGIGFEADEGFIPGLLDGQGGWQSVIGDQSDVEPQVISGEGVLSGNQSLRIEGESSQGQTWNYGGSYKAMPPLTQGRISFKMKAGDVQHSVCFIAGQNENDHETLQNNVLFWIGFHRLGYFWDDYNGRFPDADGPDYVPGRTYQFVIDFDCPKGKKSIRIYDDETNALVAEALDRPFYYSPAAVSLRSIGLEYYFIDNKPRGDTTVDEIRVTTAESHPAMVPVADRSVLEERTDHFNLESFLPRGGVVSYSASLGNGDPLSTVGASLSPQGEFRWTPQKYQGKKDYEFRITATAAGAPPMVENVVITVLIPGDFDRDGDVDISDVEVFVAAYGSGEGDERYDRDADFDGNGLVDDRDVEIFVSNWGRQQDVVPAVQGVPDAVTHAWYGVAFAQGYAMPPVVVAAMRTADGSDPGGVRIKDLNGNGMQIKIEEETSRDDEVNHGTEAVGMLVSEPGLIRNINGAVIGEVGRVTLEQTDKDAMQTVVLQHAFVKPVVLAQVGTFNDKDPVHVRVDQVAGKTFQIKLEEWDYQDGAHGQETVGYLVVEKGAHQLANGKRMVVAAPQVDHNWKNITFTTAFSKMPIVLSHCQTRKGKAPVVTRQRAVTSTGFAMALQEEEGAVNPSHVLETVGYVAFEK